MTDSFATDATIRENVAQGLEDLARYGGNVMHSDRQNLLHKAIELLRSAGATGGPMRLPRLGITHPDFDSEQDIYNSGWNACVDRWFSPHADSSGGRLADAIHAEASVSTVATDEPVAWVDRRAPESLASGELPFVHAYAKQPYSASIPLYTRSAIRAWVPVSERLPERDALVMVWSWKSGHELAKTDSTGWWNYNGGHPWSEATHWMPLPVSPDRTHR